MTPCGLFVCAFLVRATTRGFCEAITNHEIEGRQTSLFRGKVQHDQPAVVLLDLHLPVRLSGTDILHQIRADKRLTETRVIVVTGHPELAETIGDEADAVLIKPVDVSTLSDLIAHLQPRDRND
jgi:CheY-like chemotaxis protein